MSAEAAIDTLFEAARGWYEGLPAMAGFAPWPEGLERVDLPPQSQPALRDFVAHPGETTAQGRALLQATLAAAPYLHWCTAYDEAEVGRNFLDRFCFCELASPVGHFHAPDARITLAYWGPGLWYDWHWHKAEELYSVVSGGAEFLAQGLPDAHLGPEDTRLHTSDQPHAMRTHDAPVLTLVAWRGGDMTQKPDIGS